MIDTSVTFMGLSLPNPLIVSSSGLTSSFDKLKQCAAAGAGAVILKSLFEEQILADTRKMLSTADLVSHSDAYDFLNGMGQNHYIDAYLDLLEKSIKELNIPVIASINAISNGTWMDYARRIAESGAAALEVNLYISPQETDMVSSAIEQEYLKILQQLKKTVSIPVCVKIGPWFTNLIRVVNDFKQVGVEGVTMFNRFYQTDIDIDNLKLVPAKTLSVVEEMNLSLKWIALLSSDMDIDFSASTGVHDAASVIKLLLSGASTVQLCSILYKNGIEYLETIRSGVEEWMKRHDYSRISEFQGLLNHKNCENPQMYERSQYVKALVGIS